MPIRCLLWDFGDTLCDERFIWNSGPDWLEVYQSFDDGGLGASWNLGELDTRGFAARLSERMDRSVASIIAHLTERCNHIRFFEKTYAFFKARHLPQAIVTVNPDLFSEAIVPICGFAADCDAIVTSWEEGTIDKNILNRLAMQRMGLLDDTCDGGACENADALLIDNKQSNIDAWVGIGGAGYHYTNDATFERDASGGVDALATRLRPSSAVPPR
jgi:hypothetical protein